MIEFDADIGYLLDAGELDSIILNDENGEYEPITFVREREACEDISDKNGIFKCSKCDCTVEEDAVDWGTINYCPDCGSPVNI